MAKITKKELKRFNAPLKKVTSSTTKKLSSENITDKSLVNKVKFMKLPKNIKRGMSLDEAIKKYGGDMTKIPGFKTKGMDGKVKPKKKTINKKGK
jgi:hypothetical protein